MKGESPFIIKDFNPLDGGHFKRSGMGTRSVSPMNLFINRAAAAIAGNGRLKVATKYQSMLPEEYRERLSIEIQRIIDERGDARNKDPLHLRSSKPRWLMPP